MENAIDTAALAGSTGATDLSVIGMFLHADIVVKAVMFMLLLASVLLVLTAVVIVLADREGSDARGA